MVDASESVKGWFSHMSKLNRCLRRPKLLWLMISSLTFVLSGCGDLTAKEKRQQHMRYRIEQAYRQPLRVMLAKVRKGYQGNRPPLTKTKRKKGLWK
jgi:hypothetical protein